MSSTSSSVCENCDYCQCHYSIDDTYSYYGKPAVSRHGPIYTTIKHPLIYYAEVQRPNKRQRDDQPRKENRNCFVKAFRWYTQERVPGQNKCCTDTVPERCGFANWLDTKYVEYLRESRQNQTYQLTAQDTATIEPCAPCSPCTTKRFARVRSPWRKRRRPCKDSGDVPEKCPNQSCEFIMQPKDLTRAASDCYPTQTSGCIKSNATVVSSNVPGTIRCSGRSRSLSSVCRERSVPKQIDTIPCIVQEGSKTQEPVKQREQMQQVPSKSRRADVSCQCPEEKVIPVNVETQYEARCVTSSSTEAHGPCFCFITPECQPPKVQSRKISIPEIQPTVIPSTQNYTPKKQKKTKRSNVTCQCPEENIVKVETQCQCLPEPICECRNVSAPYRDVQEVNQVFGPKTIRRQSYSTVAINEDVTCECPVKEAATITKCTCSLTCFANDAVQTSDHAICLETYPLFMKIVCADRLNNECF